LRSDDSNIKPIAIFTDGFEFHVEPEKSECRLTDDVQKRRSILESGRYLVWSITWNDLADADAEDAKLSFLHKPVVDNVLKIHAVNTLKAASKPVPDVSTVTSNAWEQFISYLNCPVEDSWRVLAESAAGVFLGSFALQGKGVELDKLLDSVGTWRSGDSPVPINKETGDWLWLSRISLSEDVLAYALAEELSGGKYERLRIDLRLDDSHAERQKVKTYSLRWRQFLAMLNFFQFANNYSVFTTTEVIDGTAPEIVIDLGAGLSADWVEILEETASSLEPLVRAMASAKCTVPQVEYYSNDVPDDAFAEMAWVSDDKNIVLLIGDQTSFANKWAEAGFKVFTDNDIHALGINAVVDQLPKV